ncbi:MAG: galactokinase [Bdellovibrionota bacterium]
MKKINIKSPTRVDLAGGTLDLWPLYNFIGGAKTVNVAIDIWTEVDIEPRSDQSVEINSLDLNFKKIFSNFEEIISGTEPEMALFRPLFRHFRPEGGFTLKTQSQSPVGGGLGGSSSLVVGLIKALSSLHSSKLGTSHEIAHLAHNIEAEILNTPTGTQDYYPAVSGGLNLLTYDFSGIQQEVLSVKGSPLDENFLLVNTGKAHHSGLNNFEVLKLAVQKDKKTLQALRDLKEVAINTEKVCRQGSWDQLPGLFQKEYKYRTELSAAFTSPEIEKLHSLSLKAGAEAVKICGAGGGGCVLVWVSPTHRQKVISECQKAGFQTLNARPVDPI